MDEIWNNLKWNLFAEAIVIFVELFFTSLIVKRLLDRQEEKTWAPVRSIVAKQIARTHYSLLHAARYIVEWYATPPNVPPLRPVEELLSRATRELERCQRLVDVNGIALSSKNMPTAVVFLEASETALKKLVFFAQGYGNAAHLVGPSPIHELEAMAGAAAFFRKQSPGDFADLDQPYILDPSALSKKYDEVAAVTGRLYFDPPRYKFVQGIVPLIYSTSTLSTMPVSTDGVTAKIFYQE